MSLLSFQSTESNNKKLYDLYDDLYDCLLDNVKRKVNFTRNDIRLVIYLTNNKKLRQILKVFSLIQFNKSNNYCHFFISLSFFIILIYSYPHTIDLEIVINYLNMATFYLQHFTIKSYKFRPSQSLNFRYLKQISYNYFDMYYKACCLIAYYLVTCYPILYI